MRLDWLNAVILLTVERVCAKEIYPMEPSPKRVDGREFPTLSIIFDVVEVSWSREI